MYILVTTSSGVSQIITGSQKYYFEDGTDPSKPLSSIYLKNSYFVDWKEYMANRYFNAISFCGEAAFLGNTLSLRTEIPFVTTDITSETRSGLGDIFFEAKYVFLLKKSYSVYTSLGVSVPTASESEFGFEKVVMSPSAGVIRKCTGGFTGFAVSYYKSIDNKDSLKIVVNDRGDTLSKVVNEIAVLPMFKYNFSRSFYTFIKPDVRYNFDSKKVFIPMTAEFGYFFQPHWVTSLSGSFHISNRDRRYDVNIVAQIKYLL